jgi:succinate dehydrogenase / fumarate reductase cytochrome b subunit
MPTWKASSALFYHLFGGLRHLAWDMGYLFAKPSLNPVTYLILALTAGATALVWLAAYLQIEG